MMVLHILNILAAACCCTIGIKQIRKNIKQKKISKGIFVTNDIECCICLETIVYAGHLTCGHNFCINCISEWFEQNIKCPMCRAESVLIVVPSEMIK